MQPRSRRRRLVPHPRPAALLGGQETPGHGLLYTLQSGNTWRLDAWWNMVAEDEQYWLFHPDFVRPSGSNTAMQWRVQWLGQPLLPGCAALRDWACANYPARTNGATLAGESWEITDEGDFTCS